MPDQHNQFQFAGIRVDALNRTTALNLILAHTEKTPASYVCLIGAHAIVECLTNEEFRDALLAADIVTPDGAPLAWFAKLTGHKNVGKVTGWPIVYGAVDGDRDCRKLRHFFVGATKPVTDAMTRNLKTRAPNCNILGAINPPFRPMTDEEVKIMAAEINAAGANIIWLGIGAPRQEIFARRLAAHLDRGVVIACGAAFDFVAGTKPIVPEFMSALGLEWLFRLVSEPKRLWRRYAIVVPKFLVLFVVELTRSAFADQRPNAAKPPR